MAKARVKVEQTFGIWKRRFSINKTGYRLKLKNIAKAIVATCVLHNLAIDFKVPLEQSELEPDPDEFGDTECFEIIERRTDRQIRQAATRKRNEIAELILRKKAQENEI